MKIQILLTILCIVYFPEQASGGSHKKKKEKHVKCWKPGKCQDPSTNTLKQEEGSKEKLSRESCLKICGKIFGEKSHCKTVSFNPKEKSCTFHSSDCKRIDASSTESWHWDAKCQNPFAKKKTSKDEPPQMTSPFLNMRCQGLMLDKCDLATNDSIKSEGNSHLDCAMSTSRLKQTRQIPFFLFDKSQNICYSMKSPTLEDFVERCRNYIAPRICREIKTGCQNVYRSNCEVKGSHVETISRVVDLQTCMDLCAIRSIDVCTIAKLMKDNSLCFLYKSTSHECFDIISESVDPKCLTGSSPGPELESDTSPPPG